MKRTVLLYFVFSCFLVSPVWASDTVRIRETQIPVLIEREDNVLFYLRVDGASGETLNEIRLRFGDDVDLSEIRAVKLYYSGTKRLAPGDRNVVRAETYVSAHAPGKTRAANPSYSVLKSVVNKPRREVVLTSDQPLFEGPNFYWISLQMSPKASLTNKVVATIEEVKVNRQNAPLLYLSESGIEHRMGVGVRHAGDDGSVSFRIPGLVTSNKGTLLGVYDVRYNNSADLQERIDIGLSRSVDGGKTWEKMRIPMTFGETGGLPSGQNGVGDPAILVDTKTNHIWIVAAWTHGIGGQRAWGASGQGMDMNHTAQLMMVKSEDDGKTWSEPMNMTSQLKDPSWFFLLQGPGRGITMEDGTLVFAMQYIGA
ncbi:MAG: exo-alpha-sialidase, partial [Odoribacter sp.]|nr:exo-alpha-sialidase [Odoribacter sp.]